MRNLLLLPILALLALPALAEDPVRLDYGENDVWFSNNNSRDMVLLGHRANGNAHSFDVASFYILADSEGYAGRRWHIVPVMIGDDEEFTISTHRGADCVLRDFRLIAATTNSPARLIIAERDFGESFADSMPVTFYWYTLMINGTGAVNVPHYQFALSKTTRSIEHYCDVEKAFERELSIGHYLRFP